MKLATWLCLASLAFLIGSAGALEMSLIGIGQALLQMLGGLVGFGAAARYLTK